MFIDIIVGTRPNFVKAAAIISAFEYHIRTGGPLRYRLIHTGQHYDTGMSDSFFQQLGLPSPDINIGVGSGTHAEQTGQIMIGYEKILMKLSPILTLVVGDVNSTLACAIVAKKFGLKVAHVEAGIRSFDLTMPEEINRILTDAISDYYFTTSDYANRNLEKLGVCKDRIFFVGNTMIDTLLSRFNDLKEPAYFSEYGINVGKYIVLTLHRPSNVDNPDELYELMNLLSVLTSDYPILFPVHPRTSRVLQGLSAVPRNFILLSPLPYLEFNFLVSRALAVVTDSGGISEETTVMNIPCITLRNSTERPETVEYGTNRLIKNRDVDLKLAFKDLYSGRWKLGDRPPLWDGKSGARIVTKLEALLC